MAQTERSNAREESSLNARTRTKQAGIRRESWHRSELSRSTRHRQSVDSVRRLEDSKPPIDQSARRSSDCPDTGYRSMSRRASAPQRSRTYDTSDYASMLSKQGRSNRPDARRASTSLRDIREHPEQSPRHPSALHRSGRRESDNDELKRYDSGISMSSSRSHRSREDKASTVKPVFRNPWQDPRPRSFTSAAQVPLPPSRTENYATRPGIPPLPGTQERPPTHQGKEPGGVADLASVAPHDSISCAGGPKQWSKGRSGSEVNRGSRHTMAGDEQTNDSRYHMSSRHGTKRSVAR